MSELLNKWAARISKANVTGGKLQRGKTVGTGFISVYPWLITCNHVAADCIGRKSTDTLDAGEITGMVIDFPFYPEKINALFQAEVVVSKPKLKSPDWGDIHDIAILRLKLIDGNGIVDGDEWSSEWKYDQSGNYVNQAVSAKGFFIEKGSLLEGSSRTSCTDGLIELDLNVDESIVGASGSPVWSLGDHAIIGMLVSQRGESASTFQYKKVYMIPMHKILDACQEHKEALLAYKEKKLDFEAGGDAETFLTDTKNEMISCLSSDHAKYALNLFLTKQQWKLDLSDSSALCEQMLKECSGNGTKIFRNLTVCTRKSLEKLEREEHFNRAKYLIMDMKKIISLLSLYVLKNESVKQLREDIVYSSSSVNLTIAHETLGSAELVSAARMQATPRFRKHDKRPTVQGQYAISHFDLEIGIGKNDSWIDEIGKKIWNVFFDQKYDESSYSRQDLRDHVRRELCADDPEKRNCYLVVSVSPQDKNESPLLDKDNRQKFKQAFPELPIIILDNTNVEGAYMVSDRDLMVELYNFLDMCERYDNRSDRKSDG